MTTLFYDPEQKALFTDSFTSTTTDGYQQTFTFSEKVYKDPEGRFIFAALGEQAWISNPEFHNTMEKVIALIKKGEGDPEDGLSLLKNLYMVNQSGQYINNLNPNELFTPPHQPRFPFNANEARKAVKEAINPSSEPVEVNEKASFARTMSHMPQHILLTHTQCFVMRSMRYTELTEAFCLSADEDKYKFLRNANVAPMRAFELTVKYGSSSGGQIHKYEQESLKGL